MADWSLPLLTSTYVDFLALMKDRDFDSASLFLNVPTNPVTGMMRYVRASNKFQEYDGAVWNDKLLAIVGGGTGGANAANARTNLGIGTMGTQNASAVVITGGVVSGLSALHVAGDSTLAGSLITGSTAVPLTHSNGKIQGLTGTYFQSLAFDAVNLIGGPYPALIGTAITALNGTNISTGTVAAARLGSGSGGAVKFLREDSTWQNMAILQGITQINVSSNVASGNLDVAISPPLTTFANAFASFIGVLSVGNSFAGAGIISNSVFRFSNGADTLTARGTIYIVEFKP